MQQTSEGWLKPLKTLAAALRNTPFHPQWFAFFREKRSLARTCESLSGLVLDVGCADAKPRDHLPGDARYVGVDYFSTASEWYRTRPDIYADAQKLPLVEACIDHALLLDVLEHIPSPDRCLSELSRVLKPGGSLTIQVPFLYPIHDAPLDYHRWTRYGLLRVAASHGFSVVEERAIGAPLETAALNTNIAMTKAVINWAAAKNPLVVLGLLLPIVVPIVNILAWVLSAVSRDEAMMPYAYRMVWVRD